MEKVLLIGGYPPPYGGINIHIQRLQHLCINNGMGCLVIDAYGDGPKTTIGDVAILQGGKIRRFLVMLNLIKQFDGSLIHIHTSVFEKFLYVGPLMFLLVRKLKRVVTIHSGSFVNMCQNAGVVKRHIIRYILDQFQRIIVVSDAQRQFLLDEFKIKPDKLCVIPAFLPPPANGKALIDDKCVQKVLKLKNRTNKLALVAGFVREYYGFHSVLDALEILEKKGIQLGVVFVFYTTSNPEYEATLRNRISSMTNVLILTELTPDIFCEIIKISDIFIRPTYMDGDSVSLREAAYFGKQIIASDCVDRPTDCVLFKTKDSDSLSEKIMAVIEDETLGQVSEKMGRNGEKIFELYNELLSRCDI